MARLRHPCSFGFAQTGQTDELLAAMTQGCEWSLSSPAGGLKLLLRFSGEADDGVAADGGIGHVPPDVVDDPHVSSRRVAPPARRETVF